MIWHLFAHWEDHSEYQSCVTHLLVFWGKTSRQEAVNLNSTFMWRLGECYHRGTEETVERKYFHLVCQSADPWPAPWGGLSWGRWRWEKHPGCTLPRTLWAAAAAESHDAPARSHGGNNEPTHTQQFVPNVFQLEVSLVPAPRPLSFSFRSK